MKLLYLSSWHGTLEYDELSLFTELGIDWFSTGLFMNPESPSLEHSPRRPINKKANPDLINEFLSFNHNYKIYSSPLLMKTFVDKFDIILVSHCSPTQLAPIEQNWQVIRHKPVIWRTYTQQSAFLEKKTQQFRNDGLKIVRVSPKERTIPFYAGDDKIIRAYVDDKEYYGWTGCDKTVLTFNNFFARREIHSNTILYTAIINSMPQVKFELYGCDNNDAPLSLGQLSWEEQKNKYMASRVYFALGSKPASVTYNLVEAMMTGCPVVTWGPQLGNMREAYDWADTYEVPEIIQNGINGLCSDNSIEIQSYINEIMKNDSLAKSISVNARKTALSIFGKEKVKNDWDGFLKSLM